MSDIQSIQVTFLDQTGAKSVRAKISPTVQVSKIIPNIITKMSLPTMAPDGTPMSYSLDHKEGGKRLQETQTLPDAGVKEGEHLIVYPEIVAGAKGKSKKPQRVELGVGHPWFEKLKDGTPGFQKVMLLAQDGHGDAQTLKIGDLSGYNKIRLVAEVIA